MSPLLKERIFVLTPEILIKGITDKIEQSNKENPMLVMGPVVAHDFIAWAIKKAFSDLTGCHVDSFSDNLECVRIYQTYKFDFEHYMFNVVSSIGAHQLTGDLRYNLVLTYERLYLITY